MEDSQKKPQQKIASLADVTQLVTFRLKQEEFAVNITEVQEIIRMLSITTLPKVPDYIKGIVNLRGKIVPIFDLRKKLALEEIAYTKETRIMVVNIEGTVMGMIVDSVSEVLRIKEETIEPPPPLVLGMSADYIKGVVNLTDRILILLDLPRLLTLEEQRKLQSLA
ncbi:MAG: chemotaxis protein CheW [Armatimonadetes bacterium]|nr:chemotaxis protein CheW [Armatimonadota bacterium]